MKKILHWGLGLLGILQLAGCAAAPLPMTAPPAQDRPFVLEEALSGRLTGHGVVTPILGDSSTFGVVLTGQWDGAVLTLVEDFHYPSGKSERKTWRLVRTGPGTYSGTREDVIGQARAWQDGSALRLDYQVLLETPLGHIQTRFQDVLYWQDDHVIHNSATASKLGLRLARVSLDMRRAD